MYQTKQSLLKNHIAFENKSKQHFVSLFSAGMRLFVRRILPLTLINSARCTRKWPGTHTASLLDYDINKIPRWKSFACTGSTQQNSKKSSTISHSKSSHVEFNLLFIAPEPQVEMRDALSLTHSDIQTKDLYVAAQKLVGQIL